MNDNISKIIKKIDNEFVNNYEDIMKYKNNLDKILIDMGFNPFNSYNEFCIMIRNNTIKFLNEKDNSNDLNNSFFSLVLNKTLRDKIKENRNFQKKLNIYFNTENNENIIKKEN